MYAVSRNIEEPNMAKMTPIMPNAIDSNNEAIHMGPAVVRPESDQVQSTPHAKYCCCLANEDLYLRINLLMLVSV